MTWSRRKRKLLTVALVLVPVAIMVGLVSESVTLYRIFCSVTGYGGTTQRAAAVHETVSKRVVTVRFDANVAPGLPWSFAPEKTEVTTHFGAPTLVWFRAENLGKETIVGRAAYNVTPYKIAPYFTKTECFCFTNEELKPGESARMPVVFYVNPKLATDPSTRDVDTITLSYTFFRSKSGGPVRDLATAQATAARQLKETPTPVQARSEW